MDQTRLRIEGMTCPGCVRSVKRVLEAVAGVRGAAVSLEQGEAVVDFDPDRASTADLVHAVEGAGYRAQPVQRGS
ncbi:MAG TPA: heavy metal-associated domain-containing protein [Burkholderiales bacterium]|nr:heavy metal-associated domain-containing protein [Burkholderiales bacterium]